LLNRAVPAAFPIRGTPLQLLLAASRYATLEVGPGGRRSPFVPRGAVHRIFVRRFMRRPTVDATPSTGSRALIALSRWRIEMGFLLGVVVLATAQPTPTSIAAGLPFLLAGIGLRAWARGYLTRRTHLTRSGPYAFVRHPLYVGSFLLGLAFAITSGAPIVPPLFVLVFLVMYLPKTTREEAFLRARYGDEYVAWADRVGRFVPRVGARATAGGSPRQWFSWQRVFGHREYLTWLGTAAALLLLWAQAVGWLNRVELYAAERLTWL
jgi:protein-S-isoprenylcysteine O-methyltransferase Ste14